MRPGEQCVMMLGTIWMLMQFAQVLATPDSVRYHQCNNFILVWVESLIYTSVSISMQFSKSIVIIGAGRAIAPPIKISDRMANYSLIIAQPRSRLSSLGTRLIIAGYSFAALIMLLTFLGSAIFTLQFAFTIVYGSRRAALLTSVYSL